MAGRSLSLLLVLIAGCGVSDLSSSDLDGAPQQTPPPPTPHACDTTGCLTAQFCNVATGRCEESAGAAEISGTIVRSCDRAPLSARVSIDGKSVCSDSSKSYFNLRALSAGGPQLLAVGKTGYKLFTKNLILQPGFNTIEIVMDPKDGCAGPVPDEVVCVCNDAQCR